MKIQNIKIEIFRNLSNIDVKFNQRLNGIAGQNGKAKPHCLVS